MKRDASGYLTNIPSMGNNGKPNTKIIYGRRRYIKIIYRRWRVMGTEYNTVFGSFQPITFREFRLRWDKNIHLGHGKPPTCALRHTLSNLYK